MKPRASHAVTLHILLNETRNRMHRRTFLRLTGQAALAGNLGATLAACAPKNDFAGIKLTRLDGQSLPLSELLGRPLLVTFWATTCPGCVEEIPLLSQLHQRFTGKGLTVLGVAMDYDPPAQVRALTEKRAIPYTIALDSGGAAARAFGNVRLTPTSFLLDAKGQIAYQKIGIIDATRVEELLKGMLGA